MQPNICPQAKEESQKHSCECSKLQADSALSCAAMATCALGLVTQALREKGPAKPYISL